MFQQLESMLLDGKDMIGLLDVIPELSNIFQYCRVVIAKYNNCMHKHVLVLVHVV